MNSRDDNARFDDEAGFLFAICPRFLDTVGGVIYISRNEFSLKDS